VLTKQRGLLFAVPSIVFRGSYCGRNLIANNSLPEHKDSRGYWPVERWILSKTKAQNEFQKENEGLSSILLGESAFLFSDLLSAFEKELLGNYAAKWPLTKVLDIGGNLVVPRFPSASGSEGEIPPIPAHVHSGYIIDGKATGQGKTEAYFFPPVDVPPYNANFGKTKTRLGLKQTVTKPDFEKALGQFGRDDSMYSLLTEYPIQAYDGWTINPGIVHSPGPWLTFEIQLPQDDFNLCCWKLGETIHDPERNKMREAFQLRGLKDGSFLTELINWETCIDSNFRSNYYRPSKVIEQGPWGRRIQIFFDLFYGEGFEIISGQRFSRLPDDRPFAGIVWSGQGLINENHVDASDDKRKEFLITPNSLFTIQCDSIIPLLVYVVFPLES